MGTNNTKERICLTKPGSGSGGSKFYIQRYEKEITLTVSEMLAAYQAVEELLREISGDLE